MVNWLIWAAEADLNANFHRDAAFARSFSSDILIY